MHCMASPFHEHAKRPCAHKQSRIDSVNRPTCASEEQQT
jgi:hypothetical protein